jgi:acetylornithine deacetylase
MRQRNEELAASPHPWVGPESYFIGEVHGGDFFNRFPTACSLVGTRRWPPSTSFEAVEFDYRDLIDRVAAETNCTIELNLQLVRDAYEIDLDHALVTGLQAAYAEVTGCPLPLAGSRVVADGAIFAAAGIPTVYHGPVGAGAHGDLESVHVDELERAVKVYVALLRRFV